MGGCVPDGEVHEGFAYDDLVKERLRIDVAQSRKICILD